MSGHAFVDETKHKGLLLVAAVVQPRDLIAVRRLMRQLCLPGQSRLHFTKKRPSRRAAIAAAICTADVAVDVYDATAIRDQRVAREASLRRMVADLARTGARRLVLEHDDSVLKHDQAALYLAVREAGAQDSLSYEHLPARAEPLLWIADAVAWCWAHGPNWQRRVSPVVRNVHRL